jgi:hypothetical protein
MEHKRSAAPEPGVCFDVVTQEALQIGFARVTGFVIALFKLSVDPSDDIASTICNLRFGDITRPCLDKDEAGFLRRIGLLSPVEAFESIVERYTLGTDPTDAAYLQALEQQIINFCLTSVTDIALFVQWWEESGAAESINLPGDSSAITIITIHKSKGLEYRAVIVPFCDWSLNPSNDTVLWAGLENSPYEAIGTMPVKYRTALGESYMAADYYRELVCSHIDNINILYVALTRAREELHIMMKRREKPATGGTFVSALVRAAVPSDGSQVKIGHLSGEVSAEGEDVTVGFGEPCTPSHQGAAVVAVTPRFASKSPESKLRLRLQSQRYFEEEGIGEFSPRKMGILLHRVFEQSDDMERIRGEVRRLSLDGVISQAEAVQLDAAISQAFVDPLVGGWFSGHWKNVRNENDIITPRGGTLRRPDRVMIGEEGCVVVDYKFGTQKLPAHSRQIEEYMSLLRDMGYGDVRGYVWYISLGEVVMA